jgi:hypothetical protein
VSSTFFGLTACPLSVLSRLRVFYLPWAVFTPLPSCVSYMSSTSPRVDTVSTASPPANCTSTTPGSLEHLRSLEYRANLEQRVYHPSLYRLLHLLLYMCRLLVRCRPPLLESTTPYINIFWKYSVLSNISTMSTGYGPRILGRCRPTHSYAIRDSGP